MKAKDLLLRMMIKDKNERYYISIKKHELEDSKQFEIYLPFTLAINQIVILSMSPVIYGKTDYTTRKNFLTEIDTEHDIKIVKCIIDEIDLKHGLQN